MSSLDWNPDATSRVNNEHYVVEGRTLYSPVGMNTLLLLTSAPWATILSTTYGTVEPVSRKFNRTEPYPM